MSIDTLEIEMARTIRQLKIEVTFLNKNEDVNGHYF